MSSLILVRHGQSTWNLQNRFTGWVDVDLSENGTKEAENAGRLINDLNLNFDFYFTSSLKRAIKTLEIILVILNGDNSKTIKDWRLNERHYGGLTGLNKNELKKKLGDEQIKKFRRSWDVSPPPIKNEEVKKYDIDSIYKAIPNDKIPVSESLKETYNRVVPFFENNIKNYLQKNKNILISAHGNSLRALCKKIFKISDNKINELEIPTGNPLLIELDDALKVINYRYLDEKRAKEIIVNK